jgi:hypothetical protein
VVSVRALVIRQKEGIGRACGVDRPLVEALGGAHAALDVEGSDVLPVLLQERHEEVDGQHDVAEQLVLGQVDVADGDAQAQHCGVSVPEAFRRAGLPFLS